MYTPLLVFLYRWRDYICDVILSYHLLSDEMELCAGMKQVDSIDSTTSTGVDQR